MTFDQPLIPGKLIRRYKRFLADIRLEDGREVTAHCANPGSMMGLAEPGLKVWVEPNDNPKRKLKFAWKLCQKDGAWIGIDTSVPNRVVGEALTEGRVEPLSGYAGFKPEQRYGANSRIDFLATGEGLPDAYVEVKNVHLMRRPGLAEFPDSVTKRGAKHLDELAAQVALGHRAIMIYCIQYTGVTEMSLAADIDPGYADAYARARAAGVAAVAMTCSIGLGGIALDHAVPIRDEGGHG